MATKINMIYSWFKDVEIMHVGSGKNKDGKAFAYVQGMVREYNGRINLYWFYGELKDDTCAPAELRGRKYDILCRVNCFKDALYLRIVEAKPVAESVPDKDRDKGQIPMRGLK